MNGNKPVFHISIYCRGCNKSKATLKRQLSAYANRLLSNPWEPSVHISLDSVDKLKEKQVIQELTYDTVITYHIKQPLFTDQDLYTAVILIIGLTMQRLYEVNLNSKSEDWMLISITPPDKDNQSNDSYDIQWSIGE